VRGVQVVDAEVDVLGIRADLLGVAVCERVVASEDRPATVEVVSAAGDAAARGSQQTSVEAAAVSMFATGRITRNRRGVVTPRVLPKSGPRSQPDVP
jgi:hypothetical protein